MTNVTVTGISEHSDCQVGRAIVATGTAGQTLTITGTTVNDYQKNGIQATGMTMNVSGSTIGPPASMKGIGQNGLVYSSRCHGHDRRQHHLRQRLRQCQRTQTRLCCCSAATNVTLRGDTITGAETDVGVAASTSDQHRRDRRPKSDRPDRPRRARHFRLRSRGGSRVDRHGDLQHLQRLEDRLGRACRHNRSV